MIPRLLIDTALLPGGGELKLFKRGEEYSIMLGGNELMNSRVSGSEEALAELALARIGGRKAPSVLIGGLGMGFTLRAALNRLPPDARVTVAELVPAVIRWARGPMAEVFGGSLDDPRVTMVQADVTDLLARDTGAHDAILLDVDNGPDGLTVETNDRLYDAAGLARAREALRPGGVLAIWSAAPDAGFTARLRRASFRTEEEVVRARGRKGARNVIWLGQR